MKYLGTSLFALLAFALPVFAQTTLININTADQKTLESLPHIGTTTAQKIIAYREANGPYATIEDIRKASSYISANYYADIAPLITVGDTGATQDTPVVASSTPPTAGSSTYTPPPSSLSVSVSVNPAIALMEVPLSFAAAAKTKSGSIDPDARILWSFGDGSSAEGNAVEKTYHYAGTYLVVATASDGATTAEGELEVAVKPSAARIAAISGEGILLANDSDSRLDLSRWRLVSSQGIFRIPQGATILPHASVLFPFHVMNLPIAFDAILTYPDGVVAARYTPAPVAPTTAAPAVVQPSPAQAGSQKVQTVEPIISPSASVLTHEDKPIIAPAAANDLAAAGAVVSDAPASSSSPTLFRSPWTFGLVGIVAAAAGAFILL